MQEFTYKNEELHCEGVSLKSIAAAVGTPTFVYSKNAMVARIRAYEAALAEAPHIVAYAIKANTNQWVIRAMAEEGAGGDVHSGGELYRALNAGVPANKIVYSGVGKTTQEMQEALSAGIMLFSVESIAELKTLSGVAREMGCIAPIALRVNPHVDAKTHPYISTGLKTAKFGIPLSYAADAFEEARRLPALNPTGVHIHIGSQITDLAPVQEAIHHGADLVRDLRQRNFDIQYFDAGGGLGITYDTEEPPEPDAHVHAALQAIHAMNLTLVLEPGRALVGNAGVLLTRVLYHKQTEEKRFVVIDAGMNDLLRPSLYDAYHEIRAVDDPGAHERVVADLVGPVCEEGDFFAKNRALPHVPGGGLMAVMSAGAYGFTMASNYNSRRRPAEVFVDGPRFALIRRRESYDDLVHHEVSGQLDWLDGNSER
jgi:diaminopimelate decarboxylase